MRVGRGNRRRLRGAGLTLGALVLAGVAAACGTSGTPAGSTAGTGSATTAPRAPTGTGASAARANLAGDPTPPPIKHVWYIEFENEGTTQSFGDPAADPYLARTLPALGALLTQYYAVGHDSNDNYIAQISGQAPDQATQDDCGTWTAVTPGAVVPPYDQYSGNGCVYPASAQTLGNQLSDAGKSWTAYLQDMGNDPGRDHTVATSNGPACGHPAVGQVDDTERAVPSDQYAARHEGFMYFTAVTDHEAFCEQHILSFQPLTADLASATKTPAFSWITPNLCSDGHDSPCVTGAPGGFPQIDDFLETWIPKIMASPAYKANGLIIVTFDEGTTDTACCGETAGASASHPNAAEPGMGGPGGGDVGAVLISPFIKPGTVSATAYNHYSTLRSIEDIFGVSHLGDAAMPQVPAFGSDVYTRR
jgi:phosphatidylinositol-3-phosphatase